jgi:nicotinate (nicotinamide) nucleotide adenylyltransferase
MFKYETSLGFLLPMLSTQTFNLRETIEKLRRRKAPSIHLIRRAPRGLRGRKGRLGIFPASFNPPTKAHVALIREAAKRFKLDEILILLELQAMDKRIVGAPLCDRLVMLKLLFERYARMSIGLSNRGLFVEKREPLRSLFPMPICYVFIVGLDTMLRVMDRKYYDDGPEELDRLFHDIRFVCANRGSDEQRAFKALIEYPGNRKYRRRISFFVLPKKFSFMSSTLVRERMKEGKPVKDMVPPSILKFIERKRLYGKRS